MYLLIAVVIVLAIGVTLLEFFSNKGDAESLPYKLKPSVFNKSEEAFFLELKKALPEGYHVFPKIRIIDFIEPLAGDSYAKWRNKIWAKHVDFLICDFHFKPVLALELNGKSHLSNQRVTRDVFVESVLKAVGLNLKWLNVGENFASAITTISEELRTAGGGHADVPADREESARME